MHKIRLIVLLAVLGAPTAQRLAAQDHFDVGLQLGASYYNGEFNENRPLNQSLPAVGAIFRYNYSPFYSLRASATFTQVQGTFKGQEYLPQVRKANFKKQVLNAEVMLEFNFIELDPDDSRHRKMLSPYINVGLGGALIGSSFYPIVPFSAGLKFTPGKRHTFALEWRFHKTFSDTIDNYALPNNGVRALAHNNDWFSFMGLIYTYRLYNQGRSCPAYK